MATARSPRAIASSAACCLFNATCVTCHDDLLSIFGVSLCPPFYLNQSIPQFKNLRCHDPLPFLYEVALRAVTVPELATPLVPLQRHSWEKFIINILVLQKNTFSQDITPWLRQRAHLGLRAPSPAWIKDEDISEEVKNCSQPSSAGHLREENPKFPLLVSPLLNLEGDWEAAISILAQASPPPPKHLLKDGSIWLDVAAAGTKPVLGNQSHGRVSPATNWLQGWIGLSENETNSTTSSATSLFHLLL